MTDKSYFQWLCSIVAGSSTRNVEDYTRLLELLHSIEFYWQHPMDENRADDGCDLRLLYFDSGLTKRGFLSSKDGVPCSVLEMMVALALKCEIHIMDDPEYGDRTAMWFWSMIDSIGLIDMTDLHFNQERAYHIIFSMLDGNYSPNGAGGLFTVHHTNIDMRKYEIWMQMSVYLQEILNM